ncbi:hypothetical protein ACFQV8_12565 [Pseudonocardia benzenivorans]
MTNADVAASRIDTPGAEVLVLAPLFTDALTRRSGSCAAWAARSGS